MPSKNTTVPCVCRHCGITFNTRTPSEIARGNGKYCSATCYHLAQTKDPSTRFWAKVDTSGDCWLWTGALTIPGYGKFDLTTTHRFSYVLAYGPIPEGMCVLHRCDVRSCVRPDHLFLGTQKENAADMITKGRHKGGAVPGKGQWDVILTDEKVNEIRRLAAAGHSQGSLAKQFGVARATIQGVINRRSWKHLP